ncbi:MAG: DUF72 domain-containing protein [Ignisphaera sp.]|uniref:DUF72 domain-containing protein n=1 Tax=Ignisphaera aggregans TaxID=334771 RepID=A0A7C4JK32_9CREN
MVVYVGCCGFCVTRSKYYLSFNVVELQETFYDLPDIDKLKRYRLEAPQHFVFAIKAWQGITHPLDLPTWKKAKFVPDKSLSNRYGFLRPTNEVFKAWERIVEAAKTLNARVVVVQTPPSFNYNEENYRNAIEFFSTIDAGDLVVGWEPRGTWIQNLDKVTDIVSRFKNVIHVVDPLKFLPAVDKSIAYFRLHGLGPGNVNYRYRYTDKDLENLCNVVSNIFKEKKDVYILFNNIYMAQDAARFIQICRYAK